jgi:hypothetical protein
MTTSPTATADTAASISSESCAEIHAETGELFICLRHCKPHRGTSISGEVVTPARMSDEVSSEDESEDEETVPLPLEIDIPEDHLPDILEVYDTDVIRSATSYKVPSYKLKSRAVWNSWEKFLDRYPIKFVRESPRVRIPSMLKDIFIFILAPPSSTLHLQRTRRTVSWIPTQ